jgi:hypothetical protein
MIEKCEMYQIQKEFSIFIIIYYEFSVESVLKTFGYLNKLGFL